MRERGRERERESEKLGLMFVFVAEWERYIEMTRWTTLKLDLAGCFITVFFFFFFFGVTVELGTVSLFCCRFFLAYVYGSTYTRKKKYWYIPTNSRLIRTAQTCLLYYYGLSIFISISIKNVSSCFIYLRAYSSAFSHSFSLPVFSSK
jgi:hypothetical protein